MTGTSEGSPALAYINSELLRELLTSNVLLVTSAIGHAKEGEGLIALIISNENLERFLGLGEDCGDGKSQLGALDRQRFGLLTMFSLLQDAINVEAESLEGASRSIAA